MAATSPIKDPENGIKMQVVNLVIADVDTDASGDTLVTFGDLKQIYHANMNFGTGFLANRQSISGNVVTFRVFKAAAGAAAVLVAAASETGSIGAASCIAFGR